MHTTINRSRAEKIGDGMAKEHRKSTPHQLPQVRARRTNAREGLPSPTPPRSKPSGWSNWLGFHSSRWRGTCGSSGPQPSTKEINSSVPICHSVIVSEIEGTTIREKWGSGKGEKREDGMPASKLKRLDPKGGESNGSGPVRSRNLETKNRKKSS